jgi:hypothetical protein
VHWVTFETEGGGLLKVKSDHIVAIYDEQGVVKLSTSAGGVHTLAKGMSVRNAAHVISEAEAE